MLENKLFNDIRSIYIFSFSKSIFYYFFCIKLIITIFLMPKENLKTKELVISIMGKSYYYTNFQKLEEQLLLENQIKQEKEKEEK